MTIRIVTLAALLCLAFHRPVLAGDGDAERMRALEEQNRRILERLEKTEQDNAGLREEVKRLGDDRSARLASEVEEYLEVNPAGAEGERGLLTRAGAFFELYGFVRLDLYYDTARANNVIVPFMVAAENGSQADRNNNTFAFDVRLTRIGFNFKFGQVGSADVTAKIETDFANFPSGVAESRETPRIRLAYINIETDGWRLRMGQDWDIASPLYPSANNEGVMWNAGNLGDRRPMIAFTYKATGKFEVTIAAGLTGAINNLDLDTTLMTPAPLSVTERDGFDVGFPHAQLRAQYTGDSWVAEKKWVVGVMGLAGAIESDTAFAGETQFTFWALGVDFNVPVCSQVFVMGECWVGEGLGDFRGNIGQAINKTTGDAIGGWGGWAEAQYRHNDKWTFLLGGTIDNVDDGDVTAGSADLNVTGYVGTRYQWAKFMVSGFDVIYWETQYGTGGLGNMIRFNFFTSVSF